MVLSDFLYDYLDEFSPFFMNPTSDLYCKRYDLNLRTILQFSNIACILCLLHRTWWYNLLHIQNVLKLTHICSAWSWYVACDMQYYVISMFLLFVHAKYVQICTLFIRLSMFCMIYGNFPQETNYSKGTLRHFDHFTAGDQFLC